MADNVQLEAVGTPGAVAATDDIGSVHYQRVKVNFGVDGAATDVSASNPLPVDVGTGATGAAKAEDAAAASADVGVASLTVRQDSIASTTSADGDYQHAKSDSVGRIYVNAAGVAVPVTDNAGSLTVDAPVGTPVFVRLSDGAAPIAALPITDNGGSLTVDGTVAVSGSVTVTDGGGSLTVDGTVTANLGTVGTTATDLAKAEDSAAASGDVGITFLTRRQDTITGDTSADGDYQHAKSNSVGRLYTSATIDAALPAGNNNIGDVDVVTLPNVTLAAGTNTNEVVGDAAHDAPAAGNPVLIGGYASAAAPADVSADADVVRGWFLRNGSQVSQPAFAGVLATTGNGASGTGVQRVTIASDSTGQIISLGPVAHDGAIAGAPVRIGLRARTSSYTSVSSDDVADAISTLDGKQIVQPFSIPENSWSSAAASGGIVNTTGVSAKAAAGANIRNYVTHVDVVNGHATVDTDVQIRDGAAGTVLWRSFAKAAGGGVSADFNPPLRGTANTLVEIANGTTGSATYFNLTGYVGP